MSKATVKSITDALGADNICAVIGVSTHSVRQARFTGSFPASWYVGIRQMCAKRRIECPESVFNFKSPSNAPRSEAG